MVYLRSLFALSYFAERRHRSQAKKTSLRYVLAFPLSFFYGHIKIGIKNRWMETHPLELNKKWLYTFTAFTGNSNISVSLHWEHIFSWEFSFLTIQISHDRRLSLTLNNIL